ncbi:outer membrane protein [Bartonella tribocorum]|uniref:Hemin-binding protein E n=1 Tax=Bartonella tribocorum TaxID=85701 RepID=A0A2M6UXK6_9HYPH|nr:outer membrane protein [Bartonella tribocorum]PIT70814.1 hemin-binding protein E [Bartonella tribocorum]
MNIKSLVTTSVIAIAAASAAQAADVIIPRETAPAVIAAAPSFSWTGFYVGGQVGNFSSTTKITVPGTDAQIFPKDNTPKPSGFMGGIYVGSNVDLGSGLVLGVETDAVWAGREETKAMKEITLGAPEVTALNDKFTAAKVELKESFENGDKVHDSYTYKEKWSGATRVRIGFAAVDRVMPYVAGGIAYAQVQGIQSVSGTRTDNNNKTTVLAGGNLYDSTKTMVGFTVGGGVDFAMTDNVLLRAEYRYSDYGKKKFMNDVHEFNYKTNDFRVGVAYKF